jgi:hypothetical protein
MFERYEANGSPALRGLERRCSQSAPPTAASGADEARAVEATPPDQITISRREPSDGHR